MTTPPLGATLDAANGGAPLPGDARLACSSVTVRFGGLIALSDVDLKVRPATVVGLVGPNGAGKTTLFGVLSGLVRPEHGQVLMDGEDITHLRPQRRAVRGLARTFQHPELFSELTVRDHLVLAHRVKHARRRIWTDLLTLGSLRPAGADEDRSVDEVVKLLGLGPVAHHPARGMPLGLARVLELGRALASSPAVLLLDEPSAGLDSSETQQFESTLRRVSRDRGISVLLVEHDVDLVMRMCSTVYVLDFGVMIASGSPDEVRADPAVRSAYLGQDASEPDSPGDGDRNGEGLRSEAAVIGPMRARDETERLPLLAVEDLWVRYADATALSGVSFCVQAGTAVVVLGANGAGKSSLARALSGLVRPSAGRVLFGGREIGGWPAHRVRREGVVHLPEGRGVFRGLTVMENVRMAASALERRGRREAVEQAFEIFPLLAARRRQLAGLLSGGEQQMLSLSRALVTTPRLLIADELSLGLAPKVVDAVFEGLARARAAGVTVIMIEQYVDRALRFADECFVLQRGELKWQGPSGEARSELLRHYLGDTMTA